MQTILIVDDEEPLRRILKIVFEKHEFQVLLASDGAEALALFESADPPVDFVLTDVVMPEMDGPELGRRLLALRASLPMAFMSGYLKSSALLFEGFAGGAPPYLQKPFLIEDLLRIVRAGISLAQAKP
jgi:two-component system cell cycle sensor histidine kinase/response regulator CckA